MLRNPKFAVEPPLPRLNAKKPLYLRLPNGGKRKLVEPPRHVQHNIPPLHRRLVDKQKLRLGAKPVEPVPPLVVQLRRLLQRDRNDLRQLVPLQLKRKHPPPSLVRRAKMVGTQVRRNKVGVPQNPKNAVPKHLPLVALNHPRPPLQQPVVLGGTLVPKLPLLAPPLFVLLVRLIVQLPRLLRPHVGQQRVQRVVVAVPLGPLVPPYRHQRLTHGRRLPRLLPLPLLHLARQHVVHHQVGLVALRLPVRIVARLLRKYAKRQLTRNYPVRRLVVLMPVAIGKRHKLQRVYPLVLPSVVPFAIRLPHVPRNHNYRKYPQFGKKFGHPIRHPVLPVGLLPLPHIIAQNTSPFISFYFLVLLETTDLYLYCPDLGLCLF